MSMHTRAAENCKSLQILNISRNSLNRFPVEICKLPGLTHLYACAPS